VPAEMHEPIASPRFCQARPDPPPADPRMAHKEGRRIKEAQMGEITLKGVRIWRFSETKGRMGAGDGFCEISTFSGICGSDSAG